MNKSFVKQLIDIVLLLKNEDDGGPGIANIKPIKREPGRDPVGWKNQPIIPEEQEQGDITVTDSSGGKKVIPSKDAPDASRGQPRDYDPEGKHRGKRGGKFFLPGEKETGGPQVEMVQAPKAKPLSQMTEADRVIARIEAREKYEEEQRNNPPRPPMGRRSKAGELSSTDLEQRQKDVSAILDLNSNAANNLIRQAIKIEWDREGNLTGQRATIKPRTDEKGYPMLRAVIKDSKIIDPLLDTIAELTSGKYQGKYAGRHLFKPFDKKQQEDAGYGHHFNENLLSFSFRGRELNENKGLEDETDAANDLSGNRFRIIINKDDLAKKKSPESIEVYIGFAPRDRGAREIQRLEWEFEGVPHAEVSKRELAAALNKGLYPKQMIDRQVERLKQLTDRAVKAGGDNNVNWHEDEDGRIDYR